MLQISRLKAQSIRILDNLDINTAPGINYFYGPNASGKTSVLETVYLLSRVKSFRSSRIGSVVRNGHKTLTIFAEGRRDNTLFRAGLEKGHGSLELRYNDQPIQTASSLARLFPVFLIAPDHNLLFYGGPKNRRHWLDWSLFHVKQDYIDVWKNYIKAVRQRNILLKQVSTISEKEIGGWERVIAEESVKVDETRKNYITAINTLMNDEYLPKVLSGATQIVYSQSCQGDELAEYLAKHRADDARKGYTSAGPHRADIKFFFQDAEISKLMSRGQLKLYGAALVSSQISLLKSKGGSGLLLVDDIDAELDLDSTKKILALLLENKVQTFISSLSESVELGDWQEQNALFHVKQGVVTRKTSIN